MMNVVLQTWAARLTVDGEVTSFLSGHTSHAVKQVGTLSLTIPLPLPAVFAIGNAVTLEASLDGVWLDDPLFTGTVRQIDDAVTSQGVTATVLCEGPLHRLTYPIGTVAFAGGAKAAPQTLITTPKHLGDDTIAWYEVDAPTGLQYDATFTPTTDSYFLWIAGILHGTNSYDASIGDKTIKKWSRIEVYQGGEKIGYANLPESNEDWDDELDYTDHDNWDDFEVYIACTIDDGAGDVTVRFISGYKPGSSSRDEYEVDNVTYQTAGKQTIHEIARGLLRRVGLTTAQYNVYEITDLDGDQIKLGGNGLVDAGQVVLGRRDQPFAFLTRLLDLFGFVIFDSPDGVVRVRPFRGNPSGTAAQTFAEASSAITVPSRTTNPRDVYNAVRVDGASGNDEDGKRFAYFYRTDPGLVEDSDYIPHPKPGEHLLTMSSSYLVSFTLCQQVHDIALVNNGESETVVVTTWPHALRPAQIVQINAPTAGFAGKAFVESVRTDIDSGGFRMTVTAWTGVDLEVSETPDPNPDDEDSEPVDPRPDDEWRPYSPIATVA